VNFLSLFLTRGLGYLFPLITIPYLVRVLGPANFGIVAFAQALNIYFSFLVNYGFELTATKELSLCRDDRQRVETIYNQVRVARLFLTLCGFLILLLLLYTVPKFKDNRVVFLFAFSRPLFVSFVQNWFFFGMERMKFIPLLNITNNILYAASVFIFIDSSADYIYVPLLVGLGTMVEGVGGLLIIRFRFGVRSSLPSLVGLLYRLKDGWRIFISLIASSVYRYSNTLIIGLLAAPEVVGYYAAAEKLLRAAWMLTVLPVSQALYPYMNRLFSESKEKALRLIRRVILLFGGATLALSVSILLLAVLIVAIILGSKYAQSVVVVRTLAFLPFLIAVSEMLGNQIMLPLNLRSAYSNIFVFANIVNITLAVLLVPHLQQFGASLALILTELFIPFAMLIYLRKKGVHTTPKG